MLRSVWRTDQEGPEEIRRGTVLACLPNTHLYKVFVFFFFPLPVCFFKAFLVFFLGSVLECWDGRVCGFVWDRILLCIPSYKSRQPHPLSDFSHLSIPDVRIIERHLCTGLSDFTPKQKSLVYQSSRNRYLVSRQGVASPKNGWAQLSFYPSWFIRWLGGLLKVALASYRPSAFPSVPLVFVWRVDVSLRHVSCSSD